MWTCDHVYNWALGNVRCHVCGGPAEPAHRLERPWGAGIEVQLVCGGCCPKHATRPPLEGGSVETLEGEQGSIFDE